MRQAHSGTYTPRKPEKYKGDPSKVTYRSSWERAAFLWLERHPHVLQWSSEEIIVPYICATDQRPHRYFMDLWIKWSNGQEELVEIKPAKQRLPPKRRGKKRGKFLEEATTYAKNQSKWAAAEAYAKKRGMKFVVWDEDFMRKAKILKW